MRLSICCAALISASILSVSASAQTAAPAATAPAIESGVLLTTSDGKRLGRISRVLTDASKAPVAATVIVDDHFVRIPVSTLTASGDGLVTSLTRAQVRKLN
jgi:hypothetical protein